MKKFLITSAVTASLILCGHALAKETPQHVEVRPTIADLSSLVRPAAIVDPETERVQYILDCAGTVKDLIVKMYRVVGPDGQIMEGKMYYTVSCPLDNPK